MALVKYQVGVPENVFTHPSILTGPGVVQLR